MKKILRYTLKTFGVIIILLLVALSIAYIYVFTHKKSIIKQVTEEIGEKVSGDVAISNVDIDFFSHFPTVSVVLEKVSVRDSMYVQHKHAFLEIDKAFFLLNIRKLISKKPPLEGLTLRGGQVYLFTDTSGYTNTYLFKPKKDAASVGTSTKGQNELKKVELDNVRVVIEDQRRHKLHDFQVNRFAGKLNENDRDFVLQVKHDIIFNSFSFNLPLGSFAKGRKVEGDYEVRYNKRLKQIQFDSIDMKIADHPFNFAGGRFDLGPNPFFALRIHTKDILYPFAKTLVTPKIATALSIVNVDKPIDADVSLAGPLKGADPLIFINWSSKNNYLTTPFTNFDNASFTGSYTNEVTPGVPRKDPNSKIEINNFTATWQGLPITSKTIKIINLYRPEVVCDLKSEFPLTKLNESLNSSTVILNSGRGMINMSYKGPIAKNKNTNSFVNGLLTITNGSVTYAPRDVELKNVNSRIVFRSSDVFVENLEANVLNNKIVMQGVAKDLLTVMSKEQNKAVLDWNIYSPSLNLASFAYLLKPQKKTVVRKRTGGGSLQQTAEQIDNVIAQGSIRVKLKADKLYYKKFQATNAVADIALLEEKYLLQKVSLQHAGGIMNLSGSLTSAGADYHNAQINVSMANMDVNRVFEAFSNFGQDGITADNLRGKLTADASVNVGITNEGAVYKDGVVGIVDFSLKDGALINYEPVKKMQVFLFKKRDFDNITFAELKDRLEIKNQEVKINRMEIQSSVLGMFVEGIFSMKGNTDMQIQVPLSNLRKRGVDYVPENLADGKKVGTSVYLRGTPGKDGNIKFKLDLFNKFKKEKGEGE